MRAGGSGASLRVDRERREVRLGATTFAEIAAGRVHGFGPRGGLHAQWLGATLHTAYQRDACAADPDYRAEVGLSGRLPAGDWTLVVRGRADGVRRRPDGIVVEELKSVRAEAPRDGLWREACRLQTAVYAWMLDADAPTGMRKEGDARPVTARLLWLRPGVGVVADEAVDWRSLDWAGLAEGVVLEARDEDDAARARRTRWQAASARLRWPFDELRPGQKEIRSTVEEAIARREQLLVQAPTGSGKTVAVLEPALRAALEDGLRLVVLTASGPQQRGIVATLERLAPGPDAIGTRLRAKQALCANDAMLCHEDHCAFALDYRAKLTSRGVLEQLEGAAPFCGPDEVARVATSADCCPYEVVLDVARRVPVTVADLNHAIDPVAQLAELGDPRERARTILVVDEAHRVFDRARSACSTAIDGAAIRQAIDASALGATPAHLVQREALEALAAWLDEEAADALGDAPDGALAWAAPDAALEGLDERLAIALAAPESTGVVGRPTAEIAFALHAHRLAVATAAPDAGVHRIGRRDGTPFLEWRCLDPTPWLAPIFAGVHAWIGASATLAPFDLSAPMLGLDPDRTRTLRIDDAFPPERRRVVIDPSVSTRAADRGRALPALAKKLAAFTAAVPGNVLLVAPSFAVADALAERWSGLRPLLRQRRDATESERDDFFERIRDERGLAALVVAGGAFAEAVDLPGDTLEGVAIVGPCVPAPDDERVLVAEALDERFGRGFDAAFAMPGIVRVVQAAGRLLRSAEDRGVIALYGARFLREPYRSLLPEHWFPHGAPEDAIGDPAEIARDFFAD